MHSSKKYFNYSINTRKHAERKYFVNNNTKYLLVITSCLYGKTQMLFSEIIPSDTFTQKISYL